MVLEWIIIQCARASGPESLVPHLGVRRRAAQLELPLLADGLTFATGGPPLMLMVARDA